MNMNKIKAKAHSMADKTMSIFRSDDVSLVRIQNTDTYMSITVDNVSDKNIADVLKATKKFYGIKKNEKVRVTFSFKKEY